MGGYPITQLRRPDGMVFTLYRGAEHPFIHALSSIDAWAVCIDLPATDDDDAATALDWGLAVGATADHRRRQRDARDGRADLHDRPAGNGHGGLRADGRSGGGIALAKFGHQAPG